jgi:hypothetical protein
MTDFTTVKKNLESKRFRVSTFATAEDYLNRSIDGVSVGIGGSVTAEQMGLYEKLSGHNRVFWHWRPGSAEDPRREAMTADMYITSVNGMAETGELINIDGNGNRPCTATRRSGSSWDGTSWPPPTRRPFGGRGTLLRRRMPSGWAGKRPAPFMEIAAMTARARSGSAGAWWSCGRP